jgi:hypothetical protein
VALLALLLAVHAVRGQDVPTLPPDWFAPPVPAVAAAEALTSTPEKSIQGATVWGVAGFRGYASGEQVAPNGLEFKPLFALDLDFNVWLWRPAGVYLFTDTTFWAQRASPGVTNNKQGVFDFSKREFDLNAGLAWNYCEFLEARAFAYSFNNLNRGDSLAAPSGYTDGFALENRFYLSPVYAFLGTEDYDVARATFVSVGYYPTKDMVDALGFKFKPGPFAHAYFNVDLPGEMLYLYGDVVFIATRSISPKLLNGDSGLAARPWPAMPHFELRIGATEMYDLQSHDLEIGVYGAVRVVY